MKPLRLLTLAVFAAATLPRLAHRGMFVDGVTYASIARNLAQGQGSFWAPFYTATIYPRFHEHPPLGFWLQSLWFRVLGDHLFVERLYAVTIGLATAGLLAAIYRQLHIDAATEESTADRHDDRSGGLDRMPVSPRSQSSVGRSPSAVGEEALGWLPVILWIAAPVVSWAIVGNLLETTVALFTTIALAAAVKAGARSDRVQGLLGAATAWSVLSGSCIVGAGLTKGPVGLFPLAAPALFLLLPDRRRARRLLAVQWLTVILWALLLWGWSPARTSLHEYFSQQVMPALAGEREVSQSSFTIVRAWLQGVVAPMFAAGILAVATAGRFVMPSRGVRARALVLFLVGLAGTLPILASAKQAGHYLVPAVPLFALAAALVLGPTATIAGQRISAQRSRTLMNIVIVLLFFGTIAGSLAPVLGRDRERLAEIDAIAAVVPLGQTVGLCPESNSDWGLHAWFERRFRVSLDAGDTPHTWFLDTRRARGSCAPANCTAATDPRRPMVLMRCRRAD